MPLCRHHRTASHSRSFAGLAAIAVALVALPQTASAAGLDPRGSDAASECGPAPGLPLATIAVPGVPSKAGALLGGAPSALEAMRAQQAGMAALMPAIALPSIQLPPLGLRPVPGAGGFDSRSASCSNPSAGLAAVQTAQTSPLGTVSRAASVFGPSGTAPAHNPPGSIANPDHYLASKRVRIGHTHFDRDWQRVQGEAIGRSALGRYLGTLSGGTDDTLNRVNRWVNQRIRYTEDRDQYGKADFWAGARRTLRSGRGDCEDIALTKMQLLAAAGFAREDMMLTIARDLVRNADHAVLVVRTGGGWRLLDNASDTVIDAAPMNDYRAILSFGAKGTWLHGT